MIFNYYKSKNIPHLIDNFYEVFFEPNDIPFSSKILPTGQSHLIYVYTEKPYEIVFSKNKFFNKGFIISGQATRYYTLKIENESSNIGISFHPTTLYKILKTDISNFTDKHLNFKEVSSKLYNTLNPIFESKVKNEDKFKIIEKEILKLSLLEDNNTKIIDEAIDTIREKDGLISLESILTTAKTSQKTLEIQFKKIVGITPGKYIKLYRFFQLMKKYESQEIDIKDLIYMYDYYDHSHFSKDFKLFMKETPKSYFQKDYPLIKKYLNE